FYAGSRATGAVYRGDLRTGKGSIFIRPAVGRMATGLKADRGRLFVSGAGTGKAFVYDLKTGAPVRQYVLSTAAGTFINAVGVTKTAAFFTDSSDAAIYKVALAADGTPVDTAERVPLTGAYQPGSGFNLNGIEATADGQTLIAVQSNTGFLYTIDP